MAGSEKSGYTNSKAMLIENAYYVLTPSALVSEERLAAYQAFVRNLKAIPVILNYEEHDYVTGTISHLPHIIASSLVNFVRDTDTKDELMKNLAAGGHDRAWLWERLREQQLSSPRDIFLLTLDEQGRVSCVKKENHP